MTPRVRAEVRDEIIRLRGERLTYQEIGNIVGLAPATVQLVCRAHYGNLVERAKVSLAREVAAARREAASAPLYRPRGAAWMTSANLVLARRLWDEGVPCAEIGRRVGTSRHALLGHAHRRNWPPHPNGALAVAGGERKPEKSHHKAGKPKRAPNALRVACRPEPLAVPTPVFRTCQWPMGEPRTKGFRFCGDLAELGRPYCLMHCRLASVGRRAA